MATKVVALLGKSLLGKVREPATGAVGLPSLCAPLVISSALNLLSALSVLKSVVLDPVTMEAKKERTSAKLSCNLSLWQGGLLCAQTCPAHKWSGANLHQTGKCIVRAGWQFESKRQVARLC